MGATWVDLQAQGTLGAAGPEWSSEGTAELWVWTSEVAFGTSEFCVAAPEEYCLSRLFQVL